MVEGLTKASDRLLETFPSAVVARVEVDAGAGNDVVELHAPALPDPAPVTAVGGPGLDLLKAADHPGRVALAGGNDQVADLLIRDGPLTTTPATLGPKDKTARLSLPVNNPVVGSDGTINTNADGRFGAPRESGKEFDRFHEGIDLRGREQDWVYPVAAGTVDAAPSTESPSEGYFLRLRHPGGFTSTYMHLHRPAHAGAGEWVAADPVTPVGYVGRTGNVPGKALPHLHLRMADTATGELLFPNVRPLKGDLIYRPDWANAVRRKDDLVRRYNAGVAALSGAGFAAHVDADLAGRDIPLLDGSLADALGLGAKWADRFDDLSMNPGGGGGPGVQAVWIGAASVADEADPDPLDLIRARLEARGFAVEQAAWEPDARGDLLRARGRFTPTGPDRVGLGVPVGFDYFDGAADGELAGSVSATAPLVLDVTFGVDLAGGSPSFWVAESSHLGFEVNASAAAPEVGMGIGALVDVTVQPTVTVSPRANAS